MFQHKENNYSSWTEILHTPHCKKDAAFDAHLNIHAYVYALIYTAIFSTLAVFCQEMLSVKPANGEKTCMNMRRDLVP